MKSLSALLIISLLSLSALANDPFQHELEFAPAIGYSTNAGLIWGIQATYLHKITDHFQLGVGGYFQKEKTRQFSSAHLQVDYNFSENFERSYFMTVGALYKNYALYSNDKNSTNAYIGAGKRFLISEKNNISYKPYVKLYNDALNGNTFEIGLLNFSWVF